MTLRSKWGPGTAAGWRFPSGDRRARSASINPDMPDIPNNWGINNIDISNLASKRAIAKICEDLLQLMFPGSHDEESVATEQLGEITASRIRSVAERLRVETFKSLRLQEPVPQSAGGKDRF